MQSFFQVEAYARLMIECLYRYRKEGKYHLHEFVVMPDHLHLLITPALGITIEKAVQFIKGGSSHNLKQVSGRQAPLWQRGFTDRRVRDINEFQRFREYIHMNPVKAGLCTLP